jgi:hypothetical protein
MKKQFNIDRLIIENGCVKIRSRDDADLVVGVLQLVKLVRAGCRFDEVWLLRSEPFKEDKHGNQ